MKKLRLDVDALAVETFAIHAAERATGTVQGMQGPSYFGTCPATCGAYCSATDGFGACFTVCGTACTTD